MKKLLYLMILLLLGEGIIFLPACSGDESESEELLDDTDNSGEGDDDDSGDGEGTINGHEYVDLGLSVKWATCNIGADSPEEYGNYYAWGMIVAGLHQNVSYGEDIAGNAEYDAARAKWGNTWRMPTLAETKELVNSCTWKWCTMNGKKGCKATSEVNGKSIFLPASGYCDYSSSRHNAGIYGYYWSSTPSNTSSYSAYVLRFGDGVLQRGTFQRRAGVSIRPVSE